MGIVFGASGVSRRTMLAALTGAGIAATWRPDWALAAEGFDPRVVAIVRTTVGIDTHNHVDVPLTPEQVVPPGTDLAADLRRSGLSAICMTFALDYQPLTETGQAYRRFHAGLDAMDALLQQSHMTRALTLSDLRTAHRRGRPTAIQAIEGCHFLEGQVERVEEAYKRGMRHLGLLHDKDASPPLGDVYTNPPVLGGLTAHGAEVVKECNRLGMLIDMAHGSDTTIAAVLELSTTPILVSHTGLDTRQGNIRMMANMMRPRLISADQARRIADAGGVIGVWTHLGDTPTEYVENIRAMVDVVGINHVCIGTDTKLTPGINPGNQRTRGSVGAVSPAPGAPRLPRPSGGQTNEAWEGETFGFYYVVVDAMLKVGFAPHEIRQIGGENFCRVFGLATRRR